MAYRLRLELAPSVSVSTVYPSMARSPIVDSTAPAGLSLPGVSQCEPLEEVVDAVVAGSLSETAPRDVTTTPRGTLELLVSRHLPSLVELEVQRSVEARTDAGAFDGATLAARMVAPRRGRAT